MSGSTSLSTSELSVGKRIRVGDDYATILYIGEVTGTSGTWLGVEWDNGATRGKHNGDRGGVQYFTCRSPNSGSFLRPNTPGLVTGTGFDTVLLGKYVDTFQTDGVESVVLGSSNGSILVEGPRLDRVRAKFSQIERLRRISLNNHDVASPGDPQAVSKLCKSVESLDLSQTLLGNWDDIADIVRYIPKLCNLELNYNRIQFTGILNTNNFPKITHLRLNSTLMSWAEACEIAIYLPELQDLQLGYNKLRGLSPSSRASTAIALKNLIALNLDSNVITDWASTMKSCSLVPNLRSLMLPSNAIALIPRRVDAPEVGQNSLALEYLALTGNPISNWSNIDSLVSWFPRLCDLSISLESLSSVLSVSSRRHFTIARLPFLKKLNGTEVSDRERMDAELFYLSWISQHEQGKDIEASHPRWKDLTTKYDRSTEIARDAVEKLGNHMISVTVSKVHGSIAQHKAVSIDGNRTALRVLPTMTTKTFGMKLRKVLKLPSSVDPESLWLLSSSNTNEAIALRCFDVDPLRDLSWSGVEDGSIIGLVQS